MKLLTSKLLAAAGAFLIWSVGTASSRAATSEVAISSFAFTPATITINVGDSIRWTNRGGSHTTTSGTPPGTPNGLWNSGGLSVGQTFTRSFPSAGSFPYYCAFHSGSMSGTIVVNPPPPPFAITNISTSPASATVSWSGGAGPFGVQMRQSIAEPICGNMAFTNTRSATVRRVSTAAYYQIVDMASHPAIAFTVAMNGALERPTPVVTAGTGSGTMRLNGDTLSFDIRYSGLSGAPTAAHIHGPAPASTTAGVLITLTPSGSGGTGVISGQVTLTPAQKAAVLGGRTYVNIHTAANGGGEIRGQIAPVGFQALADGANETVPVNSPARAIGSFALAGRDLAFNITYRGLSGTATAAHLHGAAGQGTNAGVMVNLSPFNGGAFGSSGTFDGTVTLTDAQLAALVDGLMYLNIHTAANPGGEIRGQVLPQSSAVPLTSFLSGLNERPTPVTNSANGSAIWLLEGDRLTFNVRYASLSGPATAAHIHGPAPAATSAGVLVDLAGFNNGAFGSAGALTGSILLTPAQRSNVLAGLTYVNLHTAVNPGGELRGQIVPALATTSLSGTNERPTPVITTGNGKGLFVLIGNKLYLNVTYASLSGAGTAAHLHGPADATTSAGVLLDLASFNGGAFGISGSLSGTATLTASELAALIDGLTYVNIHTVLNGGGEIRGQLVR